MFSPPPSYFLRQFHTRPEGVLARLAGWHSQLPVSIPPHPHAGNTITLIFPGFYVSVGGLNSGPLACIASSDTHLPPVNAFSAYDMDNVQWVYGVVTPSQVKEHLHTISLEF